MILDLLVFILYIQDVKNITYSEAKIEATNICENLFWQKKYNDNEKVITICEESVWKQSFPNSYDYE